MLSTSSAATIELLEKENSTKQGVIDSTAAKLADVQKTALLEKKWRQKLEEQKSSLAAEVERLKAENCVLKTKPNLDEELAAANSRIKTLEAEVAKNAQQFKVK